MKIENKLSEITRLMENIKKHSDSLNGLETIPVLEIGVILSKINKLQEEAIVLKYLCEMQQGKRVDLHSSDLIATALSQEEDRVASEKKKDEPDLNQGKEAEEAMLSAKENSNNEALEHMIEATTHSKEALEDSTIEQDSPSALSTENKKEDHESTENSEKENNTKQNAHLHTGLLDKILEEARDEENEIEQVENLVEKLDEDNEISSKPDLNEAFAKEDSSISGHLQKQPITDLMSAIGLNERYLYANDLFEGDMEEFKNAIKMLNEFESGMDAISFFESGLRSTYNWEDDNALAQALLNLIERRYL